jgi:hypothetical protein
LDGGGGGRANSRVSLVEQTLVIGECKAEEWLNDIWVLIYWSSSVERWETALKWGESVELPEVKAE